MSFTAVVCQLCSFACFSGSNSESTQPLQSAEPGIRSLRQGESKDSICFGADIWEQILIDWRDAFERAALRHKNRQWVIHPKIFVLDNLRTCGLCLQSPVFSRNMDSWGNYNEKADVLMMVSGHNYMDRFSYLSIRTLTCISSGSDLDHRPRCIATSELIN